MNAAQSPEGAQYISTGRSPVTVVVKPCEGESRDDETTVVKPAEAKPQCEKTK